MKRVAVIHTSLAILDSVDGELRRQIPDVVIHNIIDQHLLRDVADHGGVYPAAVKRMCLYVDAAAALGAQVILSACSSVGPAFDLARRLSDVPTVRIDEPMAEQAALQGGSIAVYGTVPTTLMPSCELIERTARQLGRRVKVSAYLIDGAFKALSEEKNPQKHNQMVLEKINATQGPHDVIVLAQASMAILIPALREAGKPVLYSLESGVARVKSLLEG